MEFLELAKQRYSCRKFAERKVEEEKIEKILEAAQIAPTAHNLQPFHIWVIEKEEDIQKIKLATPCHFDAKLFFVLGADAKEGWTRKYDGRQFADVDAAIVGTHMMMEMQDLGLSTTWVGHFKSEVMKEQFAMMEGYDLLAIFPTGYAAEDAKPIDMHFQRKSVETLVSRL